MAVGSTYNANAMLCQIIVSEHVEAPTKKSPNLLQVRTLSSGRYWT